MSDTYLTLNDREFSAALPSDLHRTALSHLIRPDRQEDLCFAVWQPSQGYSRTTALLHKLILPEPGERRVHGNASFAARYFERALGEAISAGGGLAFLHSHLGPGWQDMSDDDVAAEASHAASALGATGLPLVGLTAGTDGAWSARFWPKTGPKLFARKWCRNVRVVGDPFLTTWADQIAPIPGFREELRRTVSAWGTDAQGDLSRLRVGIVGAGSVGTIVAETLARTGIGNIVLIDFDSVEEVNLDRMLHATREGARVGEAKVTSLAKGISASATSQNFNVREVEYSVCEEAGFRAALDCDVLFSCVDRPWGRSTLNLISYAHLIPVVDGGILVQVTKLGTLKAADWKAHVARPGNRCLECLEQYNSGLVQAEREGRFDDPSYIAGLPETHPLKRNENVIAFSMNVASLEVLQFLMMVVRPQGLGDAGAQSFHFVPGIMDEAKFDSCLGSCPYASMVATGENCGFVPYGRHPSAEGARAKRAAAVAARRPGWIKRLWSRIAI